MGPERRTPEELTEGQRMLVMIRRGEHIGKDTGYRINGEPVLAEDFSLLCPEPDHVIDFLRGIEKVRYTNPKKFKEGREVAQKSFDAYFPVKKEEPRG